MTSDQSLAGSYTIKQTQATMQATSTSALEPVASDQSLAWPPEKHKTKRTLHSAISDHTSD